MEYTPGFSEQNKVDCFSQRGEGLYAAQTARKRNLTLHVMRTVCRYHPKPFCLFFERGDCVNKGFQQSNRECYEPLEPFIGISHKHWNNGKIMGDESAIIPLDIRNGVILTSKG